MRAGLIELKQLLDVRLFRRHYDAVTKKYPALPERRLLHEVIRRMINYLVIDLIETTQSRVDEAGPRSIDDIRKRSKPLAAMSEDVREEHLELKQFLNEQVYRHHKVQRMTSKARRVITQLFEAFLNDEKLLPPEHRVAAGETGRSARSDTSRARAVADYIAGMTDRYAILEHRRMFDPGERT